MRKRLRAGVCVRARLRRLFNRVRVRAFERVRVRGSCLRGARQVEGAFIQGRVCARARVRACVFACMRGRGAAVYAGPVDVQDPVDPVYYYINNI